VTPGVGLTRVVHRVHAVATGDATSYRDGTLTVGASEAEAILSSPALAAVRLSWTSPGDRTRIVKLLDAVEPRAKEAGSAAVDKPAGGIFPGFLGAVSGRATGRTHVLAGTAVVVAGYLPRAQEALVDMSGPAAELSPLGAIHNLVVEFDPAEGARWEEVDEALRRGALALAAHLAEAAFDSPPDDEHELPVIESGAAVAETGNGSGRLPRVGAITNLQTQGVFKDVFVFGRSYSKDLPAFFDPNLLDDGAVVSGQFGHPSLKNPTYVHQNHPVVAALRARHGRDLEFAGLVLSPEPVEMGEKERVCAYAAAICAEAGWDGAVVTKEGGGNADADMALKMDALEDAGVAAIGVYAEMAGTDGTGPPIVVAPTKATAMVSTGNYDHRLALPEMKRALGGDDLALLGVPATTAMEVPTAIVYASLSPLGWGRLTSREDHS